MIALPGGASASVARAVKTTADAAAFSLTAPVKPPKNTGANRLLSASMLANRRAPPTFGVSPTATAAAMARVGSW